LVPPDRHVERVSLLAVPQGVYERRPAHAERTRGDLDTPDLEAVHHLGEAVTGLTADDVPDRHPQVDERELAALDAFVADLGQITGGRQTRCAGLDQQQIHPRVTGHRGWIGLAQ
jgi:hypothetical protein